jgi:signal transduction histidine kinase
MVFAPISALLVLAHIENLKDQRQARVESYALLAESLAANVDGFVRDLESLTLAASLALSDRDLSQESAGPYLREIASSHGILRAAYITDSQGRVVASDSGELNGIDLSGRDYVAKLRGGAATSWSEGVASALNGGSSGELTMVHGRRIAIRSGTARGYLFLAFYPSQLATRLPPDLHGEANVSIIGANGMVLFNSNPDISPASNVWDSPIFAEARNGAALVQSERSPVEGDKRYGTFVLVPHTDWVVGITRPADAIDGPYQSRLRRDMLILSALLVSGFAAMIIIASRLSKPMSSLAGTAAAIARGEQPVVPIDAADAEVRKLEQAMETMSRAIAEREGRLLTQTHVLETLEAVGETLATELESEKAVASITSAALRLTQADAAGIYYRQDGPGAGGSALQMLGAAGTTCDFPLAANDPLVKRTLAGELLDISEVGVFPGAHQPPPLGPEGSGLLHSFLGIPIRSRYGEIHGGLFLLHSKQAAFTAQHRMLAAGLARRASVVVDNARLYGLSQQAQEELRKAGVAKTEFIGVMSHELRTPITTIYGGARLLNSRRGTLPQESVDEMIVSIEEEAERLYRLVENLLTLARSELHEEIELDILTLGPVVDQAVKQFAHRHPSRPLNVNLSPGLPFVQGEPAYLHQVLHNLISNADKYCESGLPIDIEAACEGDEVVVRVLDRGPGVGAEEIVLIFESFYRSQKTARQAGGKGLGLTVCKRLVEAMSGRIWAEMRPGGGFVAAFSLPLAPLEADDGDARQNGEHGSTGPHADEGTLEASSASAD